MKHPAPIPHDTSAQDEEDAREFDDYARTQDPVQLHAALWATRRTEGLDAATEAEFQQWLAADLVHGEAYKEMESSLDPARELPDDKIQTLKVGLRERANAAQIPTVVATDRTPSLPPSQATAKPVAQTTSRPASSGRRAWLFDMGRLFPQAATAAAVVTLVGSGLMGWDHWRSQPIFTKTYATERGQRLNIDLPDGSTLELDAATRAEVRLYRQRREVRLVDGQAMFTVHADSEKPFDVLAGEMRVTVVGTRFSVRHTRVGLDAGNTVVAVESGHVRVARVSGTPPAGGNEPSGSASQVELLAGQGVTADETGRLQPVISMAPDSVAAWRKGRISFDDTPLAQAVAEFERYGNTGLVVHDPAVGALRVGGSFDLRRIGTFAQALPQLLPVRLERRNGVTEIVDRP